MVVRLSTEDQPRQMTLNSSKIKRRGGARLGAGRKPGELTQAFRQFFERDLEVLFQALRNLALGHYREDARGRVYQVGPDRAAAVYILVRLLGRPREEAPAAEEIALLLRELRGDDQSSRT